MKLIDTLRKYELDGWIISNKHPDMDIYIWNYTQSTQYESHWDEITLMCRSLVTDKSGNIISRGFNKFFNWEENKLDLSKLNLNDAKLFEKVDGSYIGIFFYKDEWIIRSKGSFTTEQAISAKIHFDSFSDKTCFDKTLTHNFEIVYPNNRICVDYGNRDELVYLSSTDIDGNKSFIENLPMDVSRAKSYDFIFDYTTIKALNTDNEEGMVGYFPNGDMFKVKYDNYVKLHGLITRTSSYTIWECLRDGDDIKLLIENIPDEFYAFVHNTIESIETNFRRLTEEVYVDYSLIPDKETKTDKEFAEYVFKNSKYPSQMFSLRTNKDLSKWLWKEVKPEYKLPFKEE